MGQKVNPTGFRTGITEPWKSRWYAPKKEFRGLLLEDFKVRRFMKKKYRSAAIAKVEIERTRDEVKVILHSARPGVIIGRKGQEVDRLQDELQELLGRRVNLKVEEITRPEIQAQLVAEDIADQLVKRAAFRRTLKRTIEIHNGCWRKRRQNSVGRQTGWGRNVSTREKASRDRCPCQQYEQRLITDFVKH